MKKLMTSLFFLLIASAVFAQTTPKKASEVISFTEVKHDFGKIKQGAPVTYNFSFKNIAKQPVVIEFASASCGCTTPTWPKTPVMYNKSDKITAGFNAANIGPFNKTITVKVAGVELPMELNITGEVLTAEAYAKYQESKGKNNGK